MSKKTTPDVDQPPIGLSAFSSLAIRRRLTPIVQESVYALLVERRAVWSVRGQRGGTNIGTALCTEQAFDTALAAFLERVPGVAGALADQHAVHDVNARGQARVDQATADYKRRMGYREPKP